VYILEDMARLRNVVPIDLRALCSQAAAYDLIPTLTVDHFPVRIVVSGLDHWPYVALGLRPISRPARLASLVFVQVPRAIYQWL
jgi:hypothetical protein